MSVTMKDVKAISIPQGTVKKIQNVENQIIWGSYEAFPYRRLEYIQTTGNQYIDLVDKGYKSTSIAEFEGSIQKWEDTSKTTFMFGLRTQTSSWTSYKTAFLVCAHNTGTTTYEVAFNYSDKDSGWLTGTQLTYDTDHVFRLEPKKLLVDGVQIGSVSSSNLTTSTWGPTIFKMDVNSGTGDNRMISAKCKRYTQWNGSTLIVNLIPCQRKIDNVIGMYDTVNKVFYTNAGTDDFIAGPIVEEYWNVGADSISELAYIESTSNGVGAFYIQTDIPMAIKDTMTIDYQLTKATYNQSSGQFYGAMVSSDNLDTRILYTDNYTGKFITYWNGSSYKADWGASYFNTNRHTVQIGFANSSNRVQAKIDTSSYYYISNTNAAAINKLSFFGQKYDGTQYSLIAKLYSVTIRNSSNQLIHDLVPALNMNTGIAGLYDRVTGKFYGNAGSGTFNYDYKYPYRQLEYIHFNGAEYISTIFGDTAGKIGFSLDNTNSGQCIAGAFNAIPPTGNSGRYELGTINSGEIDVYYNKKITSAVSVSTYLPANTYREIRHEFQRSSWSNEKTLYWSLYDKNGTQLVSRSIGDNGYALRCPPLYYMAKDVSFNESAGTAQSFATGKIYHIENGVHTLIPAQRKVTGKCGLYDTYNNTFLEMQGTTTGQAAAGPTTVEDWK